jgi:membrane protease YdiL (CAAX protease family)
LKDAARIAA